MIPQFFTVTLWGGRATTRLNAHAITRLNPAQDSCIVYLAGGDPVRVNHSTDEIEALIAAIGQPAEIKHATEVDIQTPSRRRKAA
ncbi:hypothetical protein [Novosphingobium sp. FSW06-99]|uniref:hypothetical protein n=1 Tax=Novosphingobium sp. FSW06-99 TaxID=1739113 RepID=UPI00076BF09A|nr:hypothetical protein [Novosphingobium sp. FSW06-99]KUR80766.1 hypothetical protein AQZ49_01690 [Novosphingobium sp. FSW06-99]